MRYPSAAPGPGPGRAWALGVGGVGYLGVFQFFQNVFGNDVNVGKVGQDLGIFLKVLVTVHTWC